MRESSSPIDRQDPFLKCVIHVISTESVLNYVKSSVHGNNSTTVFSALYGLLLIDFVDFMKNPDTFVCCSEFPSIVDDLGNVMELQNCRLLFLQLETSVR